MKHGFIKVAAAAPRITVANPGCNADSIIKCMKAAKEKGVKLLVTPELCLTGATCGHLFFQRALTDEAMTQLERIAGETAGQDMLVFVGMPIAISGKLYSVAAALYEGEVLGFVPRLNTAGTVFASPAELGFDVESDGFFSASFDTDMLFDSDVIEGLDVAVQFAADRRMPVPPAADHCAAGATVICELSDAPMSVTSARDTKKQLEVESARLHAAWISAAPADGESTTDKAYSGLCLVVDDGETLAECETGESLAISEIDVFNLCDARARENTFPEAGEEHSAESWGGEVEETELTRTIKAYPFVPDEDVDDFCERAMDIQAYGIIKRMQYANCWKPVIGVSGGVDSTLVMLSCIRAMDKLGLPHSNVWAVTMPCFGTTDRTKNNAITIAEQLGATLRIIPIGESVKKHFETIGHDFSDHTVVFENAQARERTMVLMDIANKIDGLDVGTKDLSEQADGWTTFNGDQISNYDINAGLTKTMVKTIVRNYAAKCEDKVLAAALLDIDSTPVTPELLPIGDEGELIQKSEDTVGPYILQDFFLKHMVMRGGSPEKVVRLGEIAYRGMFTREELVHWMQSYLRRFFTQQYKRSTSADGPAVMGFTLSPRDGHKMPSDACPELWKDLGKKL